MTFSDKWSNNYWFNLNNTRFDLKFFIFMNTTEAETTKTNTAKIVTLNIFSHFAEVCIVFSP